MNTLTKRKRTSKSEVPDLSSPETLSKYPGVMSYQKYRKYMSVARDSRKWLESFKR